MSKQVRGFIVTWEGQNNGPYPIPSSERSYRDHKALLDAALTTHGGILQADGTWTRHSSTESRFATYLLDTTRALNQDYLPASVPWGAVGGQDSFLDLLEQPSRWQGIADGLVEMALTNSDAPWSGILYDWPDIPADKVSAQEQFVAVISDTTRAAGLPFGVSFRGIVPGDESWSPSLDVLRDITDWFDYYMYIYWNQPYSPSPFWWAEASVENALQHGFQARQIYLGLFVACYYYGDGFNYWITHDQAMQLVRENGATVEWVEDHAAGLIREKYAKIGKTGHLWIHDGDTLQPRLALADEYDLGGVMLFVLGCGAESVWQAIAEWKAPESKPTDFFSRVPTGAGEVREYAILH